MQIFRRAPGLPVSRPGKNSTINPAVHLKPIPPPDALTGPPSQCYQKCFPARYLDATNGQMTHNSLPHPKVECTQSSPFIQCSSRHSPSLFETLLGKTPSSQYSEIEFQVKPQYAKYYGLLQHSQINQATIFQAPGSRI